MGHRDKNFHKEMMIRRGFGDAAQRIQELYLAKRKDEAVAAVPDEFCDEMSLVGPVARIRERYRAWADSGITGLTIIAEQPRGDGADGGSRAITISIRVVEPMRPDAPLLHDDLFTVGVEPKPDKPSNVAKRFEIALGDIEAGFKKADVIVDRDSKTAPIHQGYIEPHAALASVSEDGATELWCTTQGHYIVRAHCARLLGLDIGRIRVTATEIGGGFGGKTVVYPSLFHECH